MIQKWKSSFFYLTIHWNLLSKHHLLTLFPVFLMSLGLYGQNNAALNKTYPYWSARIHQGYVLIHSRDLRPIENSYPSGIEFDLGWHRAGTESWQECHCLPKIGLSLAAWNFDNPDVLGQGATAMFYLQPLFRVEKKFSFSIRAAMGLSYQNRPHHPEDNPDNLSYSTRFAFPLQLGGAFHFRLGSKWWLDLHTVYNHISNGGMKQPNKGINWPTLGLGLTRYLEVPELKEGPRLDWHSDKQASSRTEISFLLTYQEPTDGLYYSSPGVEFKHARRIGRLNNLTGAVEYLHDSYRASLREEDQGHNVGAGIGHEFLLGKFRFSQQFYFYLLKTKAQKADVYQRYGLMYSMRQFWSVGVNLKVHGHVADFIDLRVARRF